MSTEDLGDAIIEEVTEPGTEGRGRGVTLNDFVAFSPTHTYIFTPCREVWVAAGVNSRLPPVRVIGADGRAASIKATTWLDQNRAVSQMTWAPGLPMLIRNRMVVDGGWIERPDMVCFNMYRPPHIEPGDAGAAGPWVEHLRAIYEAEAGHIVRWLAHRVQRPAESSWEMVAYDRG
jgi:hypothetical protein